MYTLSATQLSHNNKAVLHKQNKTEKKPLVVILLLLLLGIVAFCLVGLFACFFLISCGALAAFLQLK